MPEHLRALVVILVIATAVFVLVRQPSVAILGHALYARRRNAWLFLTLAAFLANSFWIYAAIAVIGLAFLSTRESNSLAIYYVTLFVVPAATIQIPGFGLINYAFSLSHERLLALVLFFPAYLHLLQRVDLTSFGRLAADKALAAYLILAAALSVRQGSFTGFLRECFYLFIDIFLPYFVASRILKDIHGFRDTLLSFLLASLIVAVVAVFEFLKGWLLYRPLVESLQLRWSFLNYMERAGSLRATASTGHPIALGYVMVVALGFLTYLSTLFRRRWQRAAAGLTLLGGLIASISRGPWVGAVSLLVTRLSMGQNAARNVTFALAAAAMAIPLLSAIPGGQRIVDLLPFIGETQKGSIDYREQLIENSLEVILQNPLFGAADYLETPQMEKMRQGEGIIDIVNAYLGVALNYGLVGLAFFAGFFAIVTGSVYRAFRREANPDSETAQLGKALFATLIGVLVTIGTTSSITIIPFIYWSLAGLGVAYSRLVAAGDLMSPQHSDDAPTQLD
jgi:O-antigen ligase